MPFATRPASRAKPNKGHHQSGLPAAPTFRPTAEQFRDPFAYLASIAPEAYKAGIALIVPPEGWQPPIQMLDQETGMLRKDFQVPTRIQPTHLLCKRYPTPSGAPPASLAGNSGSSPSTPKQQEAGAAAAAAKKSKAFGYEHLEDALSLHEFHRYADWAKRRHFNGPLMAGSSSSNGRKPDSAPGSSSSSSQPAEPSLEDVEAEFWRIVEAAEEQVEALYGQDIDTATYSSAFPTIKQQQRRRSASQQQQQHGRRRRRLCQLRTYASHPWNINNLPQARGSVLRFVREDVGGKPITGLMVPWVYVGSCFSAFCWHIEDHGLYSINYNHMGAAKIWYGVPAEAAAALDAAMRDALPHLFQRDRLLLHKLVTMLSPNQLVARGVPVCRAVQIPGSFVVTFPDAYHAGFNSGFNVAEAVNFAAPDWLPFGSSSVVRYRCESRYMTFSHDAMLINLVREAVAAAAAAAADAVQAAEPRLAALAAGELALRLEVEGQRQAALALQAGVTRTALMQGGAADYDPATGVHVNTQGVECAACGCDLSLAAVVSEDDPGRAGLPRAHRGPGRQQELRVLLLRYAPGQLEALLAAAVRLVPGARQAVRRRAAPGVGGRGRFMGGAVLQRPAEAEAPAASAAVAAAAVKREQDAEQQQQQRQSAAVVVKQKPAVVQQQQQPQQRCRTPAAAAAAAAAASG
ncbi:JmjC-domain-containing protein [Scenedesmus sp. NREL 46B-D3]|nr:JmjC-domain-containing protein [Scenedesmus sp. NREL 46B-D3]